MGNIEELKTSMNSVTAIKERNLGAVTEYLYHHTHTTKQILERQLGLSLPTVGQNLRRLLNAGFISRGDSLESTGGRKAQTYEFTPNARSAVGVSMRPDHVTICAVNLRGRVVARRCVPIRYRDDDRYYRDIGLIIQQFADETGRSGSPVLGVAFSIQGIVSADGTAITFGNIIGGTGLRLGTLAQSIDLPCILIHDSDASAMAELWFDDSISDAVCIYLERRPGGAVIVDGRLYQGPNMCNGTIEHMNVVPNGRRCYCGQRGCMDPYCSLDALLGAGEEPDAFFTRLHDGDPAYEERFDVWLGYLAKTIAAIRCVLAGDIILGGEAAPFLNDGDMGRLREIVESKSAFPTVDLTLRKSCCLPEQNIIGAALRYVEPFLQGIFAHSDVGE